MAPRRVSGPVPLQYKHTLTCSDLFSLRYTFVKVLPGNYDITAAHPSWTLEKVSVLTSVFPGLSQ